MAKRVCKNGVCRIVPDATVSSRAGGNMPPSIQPNYNRTTGMVPGPTTVQPSLTPIGKQRGGAAEFFLGKNQQLLNTPIHTPEVQGALEQLLGMGLGGLQQYLGQPLPQAPSFEPIAAEARRAFYQEHVPTIAERFTAFGGEGGQRSSAFPAALGAAGSQLESALASQRANFGLSAQQLQLAQQQPRLQALLAALSAGIQPRTQQTILGGSPGTLAPLAQVGGQALASAIPFIGGGLSSLLGGAFR